MGYTIHPTRSDMPLNQLSGEEVNYETMVRVLFEAQSMIYDPMSSEKDQTLGNMILSVISDLLGDRFDAVLEDSVSYAHYHAKKFAEDQGMTINELLVNLAGLTEEEAVEWVAQMENEESQDFEELFKRVDTAYDA